MLHTPINECLKANRAVRHRYHQLNTLGGYLLSPKDRRNRLRIRPRTTLKSPFHLNGHTSIPTFAGLYRPAVHPRRINSRLRVQRHLLITSRRALFSATPLINRERQRLRNATNRYIKTSTRRHYRPLTTRRRVRTLTKRHTKVS